MEYAWTRCRSKKISFAVHEGEIAGIASVSGNGQTELALALAGLLECEYDSVQLNGYSCSQSDLTRLNRMGFAHIPEDRQRMRLVLPFSVAENFILESYRDETFAKKGFLRYRIIKEHSQQLVQKFRIRVASVDEEIAHFSGGNQQKGMVAREADRKPSFLLINQPARGIDIGATEFVR